MSVLVNALVGLLTALITAAIGVIIFLAMKQVPATLSSPTLIADGILTPKRRLRCAKYTGVQNAYTVHGFIKVPIFEAVGTGVTFLTILSSSQAAIASKIDTTVVAGSSISCLITEAERSASYKPIHVIGIECKVAGRINLVSTFSGVEGNSTELRSATVPLPRGKWIQMAVITSRWKGVLTHKVRLGHTEWMVSTADVNDSYQAPPELMLVGDPTETTNCVAVDYTVSQLSIESNVVSDEALDVISITACPNCDKGLANIPSCAVAGDYLKNEVAIKLGDTTAIVESASKILQDDTAVNVAVNKLNGDMEVIPPVTGFSNNKRDGFEQQGVSKGIYYPKEEYVPFRHSPDEVSLLAPPRVVGEHKFEVFTPPTEFVPRYRESTSGLAV